MTEKRPGHAHTGWILALVLFALLACGTAAHADDAEQLKLLPGQWTYTDQTEWQEDGAEAHDVDLAFLTLGEDGSASLRCFGRDGNYACTCEGAWRGEYVPDAADQLTLLFTSTDDPQYAGTGYSVECVYSFYTESWEEEDTRYMCLILEPGSFSSVSPFESVYGSDWISLYREQGPNMQVVNCKSFVSLREKRSTSSDRIAKVPLGARVLAYPEYGEENGFLFCLYRGEYGYILSEYLEPVE